MAGEIEAKKKADAEKAKREIPQAPSSMFFMANEALGPPYRVLIDTNFLSHTVRTKLDLQKALMDLLFAKATPIITSCVMAELEKLGPKYRIALRIARDERWERIKCDHKGTYADVRAELLLGEPCLLTWYRTASLRGCRNTASTWSGRTTEISSADYGRSPVFPLSALQRANTSLNGCPTTRRASNDRESFADICMHSVGVQWVGKSTRHSGDKILGHGPFDESAHGAIDAAKRFDIWYALKVVKRRKTSNL